MEHTEIICDVCGRKIEYGRAGIRINGRVVNGRTIEDFARYDVCDECAEKIRGLCAEIRSKHDNEKMWR